MAAKKSSSTGRLLAISALWVGVVLAIVLFGIANYFGWKYHQRSDWTGSKLYSLSAKTEQILGGLERDMEVVVFMNPADPLYVLER